MAKKITTTTTVVSTIEDDDPPVANYQGNGLSPITLGLIALVFVAFVSGFSRQGNSPTINNINTGDGTTIYLNED